MQDTLYWAIKAQPVHFFHNKVWVDIFAEKPDQRSGDAINLLDRVADSIKRAIGVDDRWYSVRRIDWSIVKENPRIYIGMGQVDRWDGQVCSHCGRILSIDNFQRSRGTKLGVGRSCKDCSSVIDKLRRDTKRATQQHGPADLPPDVEPAAP